MSGSWGFQAGAQSYGYAIFLMTDDAVHYLKESNGWELGVGPTVVVVDERVAKNLSTSSFQDEAVQDIKAGGKTTGNKIDDAMDEARKDVEDAVEKVKPD